MYTWPSLPLTLWFRVWIYESCVFFSSSQGIPRPARRTTFFPLSVPSGESSFLYYSLSLGSWTAYRSGPGSSISLRTLEQEVSIPDSLPVINEVSSTAATWSESYITLLLSLVTCVRPSGLLSSFKSSHCTPSFQTSQLSFSKIQIDSKQTLH